MHQLMQPFWAQFFATSCAEFAFPTQSTRRDHEPTTGRAAWGLEAGTAGNDARRVEHEFAQARPPPWRRRVAPTLLRAMHHKLRHGRAAHDATHRLASHLGTGIGHAYGS